MKEELKNLKLKYNTLSDEHKLLKSKFHPAQAKKNTNFRCHKCDTNFETFKELKKLRSEHELQNELFMCGQYEKTFDETWKMNVHIKSHNNY